MKNVVLIAIFLCCVLIGTFIRRHFSLRKQFFSDFNFFVEKLINNISFNNEKLYVLIDKENNYDSNFKNLLEFYKKYLKGEILYENFKLEFKSNFNFLSDSEINEIADFLNSVGGRTKQEEIQFLNNNLINFRDKKQETSEKYAKYANLYFKLFVVLGVGAFIIFL